jgi:predicted metal-dependent HD superfamily phosphohydrolase
MNWSTMWQQLNLTPPSTLADELSAAYSQPHRYYHTLQHLQECLALLAQLQHLANSPAQIALALYFHDAIYDVYASDNEAKSAALAVKVLTEMGAESKLISRIETFIMDTQHHAPVLDFDSDSQLLVDIDLAILGREPARFNEYEQQIRQEYHWVSAEQFRQGRGQVLRSFLDRPTIFNTDYFRQNFEQQARLNIQMTLNTL